MGKAELRTGPRWERRPALPPLAACL